MIRVGLVDDHPLARRGVEAILGEAGDIEVSVSVGSLAQLAAAGGGAGQLDVALLDLYLGEDEPDLSGIAGLKSSTRVLIVSASARPADVFGALRAGADGYVTKLAEPEMLVLAVRTVASGGFALSPELADLLHGALSGDGLGLGERSDGRRGFPHKPLSGREQEALDYIARGFTHAQAAARMGVAASTIDTYIERIRVKLGVGNKAELTRAALTRKPAEGGR